MRYYSTRNRKNIVTSKEAIIKGIAEDGGLFVPEYFPKLPPIGELINYSYKELASEILSLYFTDYSKEQLDKAVNGAYDEKFRGEIPLGIKSIGDAHFLELFHGPSLAFKDMALTILPQLLKFALEDMKVDKDVLVLTATSGDTGKAALEGFKDIDGLNIIVFYPQGGVSPIQRLQMITQRGKNTFVAGIKGNFDHAQSGLKDIFSDVDYNDLLSKKGFILSSANSINIGRLIAQIVYYVYGYLDLVRKGKLGKDEKINVVVPTGNFGNILAAYYAKEMGLPIGKLICGSNDNKVLTDFFETGLYDRQRDLLLTSSPSMDILVSSNLERFLFHISGQDQDLTKGKMEQLKRQGRYQWDDLTDETIYADYSDEAEVSYWIKEIYEKENYIMDPHTGVAYGVYRKYLEESGDNSPTIIASTASPYKFHNKVLTSIGLDVAKDEFQGLEMLAKLMDEELPKQIEELKELPQIHNHLINKDQMKDIILDFLGLDKDD